LERALRRLLEDDRHLLENDLSERCIAARLAMYLHEGFPEHDVDVEYNRVGDIAKRFAGFQRAVPAVAVDRSRRRWQSPT
jgi:hypothetical protein